MPGSGPRPWLPPVVGAFAALSWVLLCVRWFDVGARFRPGLLAACPPVLLAVSTGALLAGWLYLRHASLRFSGPRDRARLFLVVALAIGFRLPLALGGAAGYTTSDGALSGIVAIHLRQGIERLVFVPHVPYSGSLKSHLTVPLSFLVDTPRAFALASVLFFALFVAAVYCLAHHAGGPGAGTAAGLYAAFAPPFMTQYSLSNDGNYVEVLALGSWALWLAVRWVDEPERRPRLALCAGLLLGLAFWCHILALVHAVAIAVVFLLAGGLRAMRSLLWIGVGGTLGYAPGLLWNADNGWESLGYVLPGGQHVGARDGLGLGARVLHTLSDHALVLMGYAGDYPPRLEWLMLGLAAAAVAAAALAFVAARGGPPSVRRVLIVFTLANLGIALFALPFLEGNPRYLLFLAAPIAVFLGQAFWSGRGRVVLVLLVAYGATGSLAQAVTKLDEDTAWREFVARFEQAGVRYCYSDFFVATRINFLSEERTICSAKLGPVTTEYFFDYRRRVEAAAWAALVPPNHPYADKIERRLERLGVAYERQEWLEPVLLPSRKVDPEELFPGRPIPYR
jgi:hypothetical protein